MQAGWHFFWKTIPFWITLVLVGWAMWRWLKASDEPGVLIIRWIITALVMGFVLVNAARAKDEFSKIAALLVGCVGGVIMTLVWRQKFCDFFADQITSLYTGGSAAADPTPFYSIAEAKRKRGKYLEAIAAVRAELEKFPGDFRGQMLIAEIQAEDLKELASAHDTVQEILAQEGHASKNIAYALNREADWYLKLKQDPETARAALQQIVDRLPDTEEAVLALQRLAHLGSAEDLAEQRTPRRIVLEAGEQRVGLRDQPLDIQPREEEPAVKAARLVAHLEQHPYDNDAREQLALLYARFYQRLDLATDQLEQLIAVPKQQVRQVVHWLNLLADLQIELSGNVELARQTLGRIIDLFPKTAAASSAQTRMAHINLELRSAQKSQAVKLGSYDQNIGLRAGKPAAPS